jgi:hypothetical protein
MKLDQAMEKHKKKAAAPDEKHKASSAAISLEAAANNTAAAGTADASPKTRCIEIGSLTGNLILDNSQRLRLLEYKEHQKFLNAVRSGLTLLPAPQKAGQDFKDQVMVVENLNMGR